MHLNRNWLSGVVGRDIRAVAGSRILYSIMSVTQQQPSPPLSAKVLEMAFGYAISRCVYCIAKLGIADLLRDGPRSAEELAAATHTNADALQRTLRALASVGMFTEVKPREFALTPLAGPLRSDAPDSILSMVLFLGDHMHWRVYEQMSYSLETGKRAFDHAMGQAPFEYLASHPEDAKVFDNAMRAHSAPQMPAIVEAYDFGQFGTVCDVGGGQGHLLAAILNSYPGTRGILFDMPQTIERAREKSLLPANRCELVGGSFFEEVPAADAYVVKHIIHDWDDESARKILGACRSAIHKNGKLLIAEMILSGMNEPGFSKILDIEMLLFPGGRERTAEEYAELLKASGFRMTRVIPTRSSAALIESEPV